MKEGQRPQKTCAWDQGLIFHFFIHANRETNPLSWVKSCSLMKSSTVPFRFLSRRYRSMSCISSSLAMSNRLVACLHSSFNGPSGSHLESFCDSPRAVKRFIAVIKRNPCLSNNRRYSCTGIKVFESFSLIPDCSCRYHTDSCIVDDRRVVIITTPSFRRIRCVFWSVCSRNGKCWPSPSLSKWCSDWNEITSSLVYKTECKDSKHAFVWKIDCSWN